MNTSNDKDIPSLQQLNASGIQCLLIGKLISYHPPGIADMGVHEEFHPDGFWKGIRYSRGPAPFSGRWTLENDQICVHFQEGFSEKKIASGPLCRPVWVNRQTNDLLISHLSINVFTRDKPLMRLTVRSL